MEIVALLELFAEGSDVVRKVAEALKRLYEGGTTVLDDQRLRALENRLVALQSSMAGLNALKFEAVIDINTYLEEKSWCKPWNEIQKGLESIVAALEALLQAVEVAGNDIIRRADLDVQSSLLAALRTQLSAFRSAANLREPTSKSERSALKELVNHLRTITDQVTDLQKKIRSAPRKA